MKLLLIEDDLAIRDLLTLTLTHQRYTVDVATDGQTGLELATQWDYDLLILDIQIPQLDGIRLCQTLRSQGYTRPILMLTAQTASSSLVQGFDAGADDYVVKPCEPEQLLARIRALLRRSPSNTLSPILTWGDLQVDTGAVQVRYQQRSVNLRPKEYQLLELLLRNPQRVFSRDAILDHLWTVDEYPMAHTVTNLIKDLRRHLKAAGLTDELIETLYGLGYRLKAPPLSVAKSSLEVESQPVDEKGGQSKAEKRQRGLAAIDRLKHEFQARLDQQLYPLAEAIQAIQSGRATQVQHTQAQAEAHRLAGSLGTFGYSQASDVARKIEHLFIENSSLTADQGTQLNHLLTALKQELAQPPTTPAIAPPCLRPIQLIGLSTDRVQALQELASDWDFQITPAVSSPAPLLTENQRLPTAIVLQLNPDLPKAEQFELMYALKQQAPERPMLVIAEQENLRDRLEVSRLGLARYLCEPINPNQVFASLNELLTPQAAKAARVLIVDDDSALLSRLAHLLKPWGLQVTCLNDPSQFWTVLTTTNPDLLLLDIEMPDFNGIELCQVVRQDPTYGNLPVLIVTAHRDETFITQVFEAGADDLIYKPVIGPELVTRVMSRLERWRKMCQSFSRKR